MEAFRAAHAHPPGPRVGPVRGAGRARAASCERFLRSVPVRHAADAGGPRACRAAVVPVPPMLPHAEASPAGRCPRRRASATSSPRSAAARARLKALAEHIVTTSPDVTVSTNLGPWVNRRGMFDRHTRNDVFRDAKLASAQRWGMSPRASTSSWASPSRTCSCCWARRGWRRRLTGARLLPVGTVYDPFVNRGLDALIYACYQDARFLLVSTPSGLTLAPEGGQHQSINTPLIGMAAGPAGELRAGACRRAGDPAAPRLRVHAAARRLGGVAAAVHPALRAAGAGAGPGGSDRRRRIGWCRRAGGARIAIAYQGAGGAARPRRPSPCCGRRSRGPGCWRSPARTGCTPAGCAAQRARRQGRKAGSHVERSARAAGAGCGAGDGAGRPPGDACLAGRGARPAGGAAGAGQFGQCGD